MEPNLFVRKPQKRPLRVLLPGALEKCTRLAQLLNCYHWKMSSERMGVFWTFLDTGKFDKALRCIASDFRCGALHSERHTTLLVDAIAAGLCKNADQEKQCLELIKALRDSGASWTQTCKSTHSWEVWKNADPKNTKISVPYGTHSALSFTQAWLRVLHEKKGWQEDVSYLHKVLEIYLGEPQPSRNKLAIDEDIVSKLRSSEVLSVFYPKIPKYEQEKNRVPHHWVWQNYPFSHLDNSLVPIQV